LLGAGAGWPSMYGAVGAVGAGIGCYIAS